jgi:serine/threonine protein kinase
VEGGELLDAITKMGHFTERVASTFFKQAVQALLHVHSAGYVHRDVKVLSCFATQILIN